MDDEIENALMFINPFDRDTWLNVGMGLKAHGVSQGSFGIAGLVVVRKNSHKKSQNTAWKSFKKDDIKIGTVIDLAKKGGYIPTPNFGDEDLFLTLT